MSTRRTFLQQSSLSLGALFLQQPGFATNPVGIASLPKPGIQLFTLFNEMDIDTIGTLKKVAAAGYVNIESAFSKQVGYYGRTAKEFRKLLADMGMQWRSHHVLGAPFKMPADAKPILDANGNEIKIPPMANLRDNSQQLVDEIAEAGIPYLVCANTPIGTADEIKASAATLQKAGEQAKKAGLTLVYHNHDAEFKTTDGIVAYDYFLSQVSADILRMELDLGWALKAGMNPVELFRKHPGRFPLWHVKDMDAAGNIVSFGEGIFDFKPVFHAAKTSGMEYFFIEQDFPKHPFENIVQSIEKYKTFSKNI